MASNWYVLTGGNLLNLDHVMEIPSCVSPASCPRKIELQMSDSTIKHVSQSDAAEIRELVME